MFAYSVQWLGLAVDATVKSLLLALLAAVILRALRIRNSHVRHRVWTGVLAGMLMLPLLSQTVPQLQLPIHLPPEWLVVAEEPAPAASPVATSEQAAMETTFVATNPPANGFSGVSPDSLDSPPAGFDDQALRLGRDDLRQQDPIPSFANVETTGATTTPAIDSPTTVAAALAPPRLSIAQRLIQRWPQLLAGLWLIGSLIMLARLLIGMVAAWRLKRTSTAITRSDLEELGVPAASWPSQVRSATLLECPLIRVPLTLGLFRPVVLLPTEWLEWSSEKLEAVLLHERTHVERGDSAIAFLTEVAVSVHWLNPLAWWLRQRLSALAEEACDDAAIELTGDRTTYARHLLEVAAAVSTVRGRIIPASVSMARRSNVETRIDAILDFTRPLSERPTWATTLLILLVAAPVIAVAAALRPGTSADSVPVQGATEAVVKGDLAQIVPADSKPEANVANEKELVFHYAGTVADESGRPVTGASIHFINWRTPAGKPALEVVATTGPDGKFELSRKKSDFGNAEEPKPWQYAEFIATKSGSGIAAGHSLFFETTGQVAAGMTDEQRRWLAAEDRVTTNVLTLPADLPIRGRIVNTEGGPVAGATVEVLNADEGKGGTLEAWEAATKKPGANFYSARHELRRLFGGDFVNGPVDRTIAPAVTDPDGRFVLTGLGRERMASVVISGPGIESTIVRVRSRAGETIKLPYSERGDDDYRDTYYPAEFTHVAGPSQPVEGVLTDLKTGKPLVGFPVSGHRIATHPVSGHAGFIRSITDEQGRFRLTGLPLGSNDFVVLPAPGSRYLAAGASVTTKASTEPLMKNVALTEGVLARGTVTDSVTGKPIAGYAEYFAFSDNPSLNETRNFRDIDQRSRYRTDAQGHFEIPVLPGAGIVTFMAADHLKYPRGAGKEDIKGPDAGIGGAKYAFTTSPYIVMANNFHSLTQVEPAADADMIELTVKLTPTLTFNGRVVAADARKVTAYHLFGENAPSNWYDHPVEPFTVNGYLPQYGRRLMAFEAQTSLIGKLDLTGEPPQEAVITLGPATRFIGRVVDEDGAPIPRLKIENHRRAEQVSWEERWRGKFDPDYAEFLEVHGNVLLTDADGRFELRGVMPGLKYSARVSSMQKGFSGRNEYREIGTIFVDLLAKPGATNDLGDVKIVPPKPRMEAPKTTAAMPAEKSKGPTAGEMPVQPPKQPDNASGGGAPITVAGRVVDENGRGIAGALLQSHYAKTLPPRSVADIELRTFGSTDAAGHYEFTIAEPQRIGSSDRLQLFVRSPGKGLGLIDLTTQASERELATVLRPELPFSGRLVDTEARPVANANVRVLSVLMPRDGGSLNPALAAWKKEPHVAFQWLTRYTNVFLALNTTTDREGRFTLPGVSAECLCKLDISAPQFATATLWLVNRSGFDARPFVSIPRNDAPAPGQTLHAPGFTYLWEPGTTIRGVVTGDGLPLVGVNVSANGMGNSELFCQTDADGRYELVGVPRNQNKLIMVHPDSASDYLPRTLPFETLVDRPEATLDVPLSRGIVITGRVTDGSAGDGVEAGIRFAPLPGNQYAKQAGYDTFERDHTMRSVEADGRYRLLVIPGPGVLLVQGHGSRVSIGDNRISPFRHPQLNQVEKDTIRPYGEGYFTTAYGNSESLHLQNAIRCVDFPVGADPQQIDLQFDRGQTAELRIVDEAGSEIPDAFVSGISEHWPITARLSGARCPIVALGADRPRQVLLLHEKRGLAGSVTLTGAETAAVDVILKPSASIRGRAVDEFGVALEKVELLFTFNDKTASELYRFHDADKPKLLTGEDGRFEIRNIVPGPKYSLGARQEANVIWARLTSEQRTLSAGQQLDLGDVVFAPPKPQTAAKASTAQTTSSAATRQESVTVSGVVLLPNGQPAAGATVRVAAPVWAMMKPILGEDFRCPMTETTADPQGRFSVQVAMKPFGDVSALDPTWQEIWKRTVIAASKDGFGPQWVEYGDTKPGEVVTLTLVEDQPIRGRVIDLEGRPVAGATVKIGDPRAAKDDNLAAWIEGIRSGELPWTVYEKARRSIEPRLIGLHDTMTTSADGTFEIQGLGKDRLLTVVFEGESVAHRGATLVSRTMAPMKRLVSPPPFEGWEPVFGADFTFTSDPARVVEGIVKDAATGQALAGVSIESYRLVGYPYSNHRVLKTVSDSQGKFRLVGMPKGKGNRLLAIPNDDQPFFMRQVDVPDPVGLDPATMDVELHRGLWITGRVTNQSTGEGVAGVRLHYLPYLSNEHVRALPEFDRGNVDGDQMRYVTSRDGTYRLVGMPGRAILGAESVLTSFRSGQGYAELKEAGYGKGDRAETYRNPVTPGPKWPTAMKEIDPAADTDSITIDFALDPGATVRLSLVDEQGKPVSGASIVGLTGMGYQKADPGSEQNIVNLGPNETRTIIIHHEARGLGRIVPVGPDEVAAGKITAELQPTGTITGRLLKDDAPMKGAAVEFRLHPSGDFGKSLPKVATDAEGRFECTVLTGTQYMVYVEGAGIDLSASLGDTIAIEPGEKRDLGTLILGDNRKFMSAPSALSTTNGK